MDFDSGRKIMDYRRSVEECGIQRLMGGYWIQKSMKEMFDYEIHKRVMDL